mmetsp:Transcript_13419/g.26486  ORF Transcript_13419/g.26486 Transcript_13419/m.26486 type:complete len:95 (-) Transcript_13419:327-611(-)
MPASSVPARLIQWCIRAGMGEPSRLDDSEEGGSKGLPGPQKSGVWNPPIRWGESLRKSPRELVDERRRQGADEAEAVRYMAPLPLPELSQESRR